MPTTAIIQRFGHLFRVVDRGTILIDDLCGYLTTTPAFQIEEYLKRIGLIIHDETLPVHHIDLKLDVPPPTESSPVETVPEWPLASDQPPTLVDELRRAMDHA